MCVCVCVCVCLYVYMYKYNVYIYISIYVHTHTHTHTQTHTYIHTGYILRGHAGGRQSSIRGKGTQGLRSASHAPRSRPLRYQEHGEDTPWSFRGTYLSMYVCICAYVRIHQALNAKRYTPNATRQTLHAVTNMKKTRVI